MSLFFKLGRDMFNTLFGLTSHNRMEMRDNNLPIFILIACATCCLSSLALLMSMIVCIIVNLLSTITAESVWLRIGHTCLLERFAM